MTTEQLQKVETIKILLTAYFEGEMSSEQRSELAAWLIADRANRETFMRLKNRNLLYAYYQRNHAIDARKEYLSLSKRIQAKTKKRDTIRIIWQATACAAVLSLLYLGLIEFGVKSETEREVVAVVKEEIPDKVTFHAADGEVIKIDKESTITELVTKRKPIPTKEVKLNKVVVPEGLESKFTLPDGTMVHMNSSSSLSFPETFAENSRQVEFEGEVYFNVTRDSLRPFRVQSGDFSVEVLGTIFIARANGENFSTILAEGSVRMNYKTESIQLEPGKCGSLMDGKLIATNADLEKEFDWVNGCYIFQDESLETITKKLSLFYGVEFIFVNDEVKEYCFSGKITKGKGIDDAINSLELINIIKFHKKGNIISITKNR